MTTLTDRFGRPRWLLDIVLWLSAGFIIFTAHAGVLVWALRKPPVAMADQAPQPAIMIDLAAEPEAANTDMNEIVDQTKDAVEVASKSMEPVQERSEPVEEKTEDTPTEKPVKTKPDETEAVEQEVTAKLEKVEVPLPTATPKPPEKKVAKKKPEKPKKPTPKKQRQASKTSTAAAAQVQQSNRTAARQTVASFGFGSVSPAEWQSRLMAHLERRKRYPPGAREKGEMGTVYVRFRIDASGNVLSATLARSSGFPELDNEVLSLVHRASPVPAPPPGANKLITAPVRFTSR